MSDVIFTRVFFVFYKMEIDSFIFNPRAFKFMTDRYGNSYNRVAFNLWVKR